MRSEAEEAAARDLAARNGGANLIRGAKMIHKTPLMDCSAITHFSSAAAVWRRQARFEFVLLFVDEFDSRFVFAFFHKILSVTKNT